MVIVFDMDNTLTDDFGGSVRPGVVDLLRRLVTEGDSLILWTNSTADRAKSVLQTHDLMRYFGQCLFREDYAQKQKGVPKDIRRVNGDLLVDDDPRQIEYNKSTGKQGFQISSYRGGTVLDEKELDRLYAEIRRLRSGGGWSKLRNYFLRK